MIAVKVGPKFKHRGFEDIEEAARFAVQCDHEHLETYHACATFKKRPYKDEQGRFIARTSSNWNTAKAFWVDIDCGVDKAEHGKGYRTQKEACAALLGWCSENELPFPMVISSGRGVHAYWCLTEELEAVRWIKAASALKQALFDGGILADPSRTADFASVLRPVGTHNHKDNPPKDVRLALDQKEPIDTEAFVAKLLSLGGEIEVPSWLTGEPVENLVEYTDIDTSAKLVAEKCRAVQIMRDTKGDVSYDHWRGVIGVIKYCTEGLPLAQEWTSRRAETGHQSLDVETRFNTWNSGPTTCAFFENCTHGACEGCQFKGKIKTPLVLGRTVPESKPESVKATLEGDTREVTLDIPELPHGYGWDGQSMVRYIQDKDGVLHAESFCPFRFYFVGRVADETGRFRFLVRAHLPRGIVREFYLDAAIVSAGGSKLMEALGAYEIVTTNAKNSGNHMHAYVKDSIMQIAKQQDVVNTYSHFGWQSDHSFLVGSRLYTPKGEIKEVLLSGHALRSAEAFPSPKGSVEDYCSHINWLYNREGMEPMQYVICSLWAAPLVDFCEPTYNGIPVAMTGAESGKGKTTAAIAALYAFGEPTKNLCIAGKEGATVKAQAAIIGTLKNLPMLFDEVTNKTRFQLSDLCYALSNGVESLRLRATGGRVEFGERESWRTHVAMTGNTCIGVRLSEGGNSEAEAMRVFEIRIDSYNIPKLDPVEVSKRVTEMSKDVGAAGEKIISYLVQHRSDAKAMLEQTERELQQDPDLASQPKYRFYRNHMVCTITMAKLAKQLGLIEFDIDKLAEFAKTCVRNIFESVQETNSLAADVALAKMLTDLSPRIATTLTYERPPNSPAYILNCPQGLVGRAIRGSDNVKDEKLDGKMLLSVTAVKWWCNQNRIDATVFREDLKQLGVLCAVNERYCLGKNTNVASAQQRCWVLDIDRMEQLKPEGKEEVNNG